MMNNLVLTHYTKNINTIISIFELGFFYSYCPTRIFDHLFQDANIDAQEPDDHAMICFTELDIDTACEHRNKFGKYGVAISLEWAIKMGARKVEYIKRNSVRYNDLLQKLKSSVPTSPFGYSTGEQQLPRLEKTLRQFWLGDPLAARFVGAESDYLELLRNLLWVQIECHKDQIEWRIRNPQSVSGMQFRKPTKADIKFGRVNRNLFNLDSKEDFVKLAIDIMSRDETLRQSGFLSIPPEEVRFIIVPKAERNLLQEKLSETRFKNVKIIG